MILIHCPIIGVATEVGTEVKVQVPSSSHVLPLGTRLKGTTQKAGGFSPSKGG
jgi:hypothetical protein